MVRVITGFNVINAPNGQRLGFTYSEMNEDGKTVKDNYKGSMIVLDETAQENINSLKEFISKWIEKQNEEVQ